jgi:hypothetical protein
MKILSLAETDTLYIEFRDVPVAETRDLDENMSRRSSTSSSQHRGRADRAPEAAYNAADPFRPRS